MAEPNPMGANQYQLDPRQKLCWEYYINPKSETFSNGYQSAMRAGYEEGYAAQITTVDWFLDKVRRLKLVSKGEKVLEETLEYDILNEDGKRDPAIARLKLDAAKHVTSTLGKDLGYSMRTEQTGPDGVPLTITVVKYTDDNADTAQL
jgi:hypothetical protein